MIAQWHLWRSFQINGRYGKKLWAHYYPWPDEENFRPCCFQRTWRLQFALFEKKTCWRRFQRENCNSKGKLEFDVVIFSSRASTILQDFQNRKAFDDIELEKMRIIKTSDDITWNEIKQLDNSTIFYPAVKKIETSNDFPLSKFAPPTLLPFLNNLISCKNSGLLVASITHAIIQNTTPRSIMAPIQLMFAAILHRHVESRYFINILHKFGLFV